MWLPWARPRLSHTHGLPHWARLQVRSQHACARTPCAYYTASHSNTSLAIHTRCVCQPMHAACTCHLRSLQLVALTPDSSVDGAQQRIRQTCRYSCSAGVHSWIGLCGWEGKSWCCKCLALSRLVEARAALHAPHRLQLLEHEPL